MAILGLIEYADASPEVRAIYDEYHGHAGTDWINNFWKALARSLNAAPHVEQREREPPGLDAVTKEMSHLAV